MKSTHEAILNAWQLGFTSTRLADLLSCSRGFVCNVVIRARDKGDPRATRRRRGRM